MNPGTIPSTRLVYHPVSGNIVFPQSLKMQNARLTHFYFEGNKTLLEKFCTEWFNQTSAGALKLKPVSNTVVFTFYNLSCSLGNCTGYREKREVCDETQCSIAYLRDNDGSILAGLKYNEVSFSFLVEDEMHRHYFFSPFRLTDDGIAMANYREAFGFPDAFGEVRDLRMHASEFSHGGTSREFCIERSCACAKGGVWLCCKSHLPQFDDGTVDVSKNFTYPSTRIFWIENEPDTSGSRLPSWRSRAEMGASLPLFLSDKLPEGRSVLQHRKNCFNLSEMVWMAGKRVSLIQYRKSIGGPDAIYQAALVFGASNVNIHGGGELAGKFSLHFHDREGTYLNDLAFARDFGLISDESRIAKAAVWVECDFELEPSHYLWVNRAANE